MQPRSIPQISSKGRKAEAPQKPVKKPASSDEDDYGDDFEDEEDNHRVEKEILAKPNIGISKQKIMLNNDEQTKPITPRGKVPPQAESKKAASLTLEDEPVKLPSKPEDLRSFNEDKKPEISYVDPEVRDAQKERVRYLREFLALEYERFDSLLEILPSGEYELYVSRIQNGILTNSGDQTNDDRTTRDTQTEDDFQSEFGNQWPEDKNRNVFTTASNREAFLREEQPKDDLQPEDTNKLIEFVKNAYPVMDEILTYQTKNITTKDKMMNIPAVEEVFNFPEELAAIFENVKLLSAFEASKTQIFASYSVNFSINSRNFPLGLVIEYLNTFPSRYFIGLSEIVSLYISINFRHALIGGTREGSILLWDLRDSNLFHSKNVHEIVTKIKEKEAGRFGEQFIYRFPNYTTDYLGESGHTSTIINIKDTYSSKNVYEIFSLDEFGKVINWNLAILNKSEASQTFSDPGTNFDSKIKLVKIAEFDINEHYAAVVPSTEALLCANMDIDKLGTSIFVCNQKGMAKIETLGNTKPPKTYQNGVYEHGPTCVAVSASEYLYVGNRDGTIAILSKNFSKPVAMLGPFTKNMITYIVLPKYYPITLRNPSKYLDQLTKPIAFDNEGNIYLFSLDQSFMPTGTENPIKEIAKDQPFKLLHVWFEGNLDMHMLYSINKIQLCHINLNCSKFLDITHEPIMQKQKRISLLFKVT